MTYEEIYEKLKSELPSDVYAENAEFLRKEGMKYGEAGNFDGVRAAGRLMGELMPPEQMDEIQRLTHIDGVRLDDFYGRIVQLGSEKNFVDAKPLAEQLYNKIIDGFSEGESFFSFHSAILSRTTSASTFSQQEKLLTEHLLTLVHTSQHTLLL